MIDTAPVRAVRLGVTHEEQLGHGAVTTG